MEQIKVVACIKLTGTEELLVTATGEPPERLERYISHDQQVGRVRDFLNSKRLPWSEQFVSVFVLLPDDDATSLHDAFGHCFELKLDAVLHDLEVVCSDDIQNCAVNKRDPKFSADLRPLEREEKIKALRMARAASDEKRAEARMSRPLRLRDVLARDRT